MGDPTHGLASPRVFHLLLVKEHNQDKPDAGQRLGKAAWSLNSVINCVMLNKK